MEEKAERYGANTLYRALWQEERRHCQRVAEYMKIIVKAMMKKEADILGNEIQYDRLGEIFLYHDIGKAYVPGVILHKADKLTGEEKQIMQKHTEYGRQILKDEKYLADNSEKRYYDIAIQIAYSHHEWWNGEGYPQGLKGKKIPLLARVCSVADVYDALLSDRPYRKAVPISIVRKRLKEMSGVHFDPEIVKVFIDECEIAEEIKQEKAD